MRIAQQADRHRRSIIQWQQMQAGECDELKFFEAIHDAGVRALLIGRRALVFLGLPVLTADYDFWIDDLILTKRFSNRPRDAEDVRLLRVMKDEGHR